ncbi:MAG: OmpA family protein [Gammaproteobacteria bacterium]
MLIKKAGLSAVAATFVLGIGGCTTINPYTGDEQTAKATKGALIGAGIGALAGIISGSDSRDRRKRALIGAGIGGITGGSIGYYMDVQEAKLRKELADTGIVFERQGDNIVLAMPGNVTFDVNKADIKPQFVSVLDRLARIFNEKNQTFIEVVGHTDSTGSDSINQALSERRAQSVVNYLANRSVVNDRLAGFGKSSAYPIADNGTEQGRQLNRRVEITLVPIT